MGLVDQERQMAIMNYLRENKKATVAALSEKFAASEATIRRDLTKLEKQGHLLKTYGGAILSSPTQFEFSYNDRLLRHVRQKRHIGAYAAKLVKPGDSILLDSGTTSLQIAENLKDRTDLTVVTNGLMIAQKLGTSNGIQLYLLGGCFRPKSQDMVGPLLINNLANFSLDMAFLSVDGFDSSFGLSAADPSEAEVARASIKSAHKTIIVADSSKGRKRAFAWICEIKSVNMIISDKGLDKSIVDEIQQHGVEMVLV